MKNDLIVVICPVPMAYTEEVGGSSPSPPTQESLRKGFFILITGYPGTCIHRNGSQAVPYGVIDRGDMGYYVVYTPHVHF